MMHNSSPWEWIVFGVLFSALGGYMVVTGEEWFSWGRFAIFSWAGWVFLLSGCAILILSLRSCRNRKNNHKPKVYTAEEIAQAEAEMDALYLKEHGEPPDKNGREA